MLEGNREAVARVAKTFGQNGELTLSLFDSFPRDLNLSEPLFVEIDKLAVPLFLDHFQRRGQRGATAIFGDFDTQRRAEELVGMLLYRTAAGSETLGDPEADGSDGSDGEDDPDDGEIYLEDLTGYTILLQGEASQHGGRDSDSTDDRIEEFIDGENPLFRATIGGYEVFIPAVETFITAIDTEQRTIEFDLPEGLLALYLP